MSAQEILESINCLLEELAKFLNSKELKKSLTKNLDLQNEADRLLKEAKSKRDLLKTFAEQLGENKIVNYVSMENLKIEEPSEEILSDYIEGDNLEPVEYEQEPEEETYDVPIVDATDTGSSDATLQTTAPTAESLECPYNCSTYNQVNELAIKTGSLYRKEKRFILGQKKTFTAILIGNWLLLYSNKKSKPLQYIDITDHEARKKKESMFEIIGEGKQSIEFYAKTSKEMENWITTINCLKNSNSVTSEPMEDKTNVIVTEDDESGEIYATIEDLKQDLTKQNKASKETDKRKLPDVPPQLPKRSKNVLLSKLKEKKKNEKVNPKFIKYVNLSEANGTDEIIEEEYYDELLVTTETVIDDKNEIDNNLRTTSQNTVYEETEEDNVYDELANYQPRPVNPSQTGLTEPNRSSEQASPIEEEEVYDEIANCKPIFQESGSNHDKNISGLISDETTAIEEEDIYDELVPIVSKKMDNQQQNNNPEANVQVNEDIYDDLVPTISPEFVNTSKTSQLILEGNEEDDVYDDLARVIPQPPNESAERAKSKIYILQKELFQSKPPVNEKPKFSAKKILMEKKDESSISNQIKESPRKLESLIKQMERNLSFNKR